MRKVITLALVAGLIGGIGASPAAAAKKSLKYTFTAPASNPTTTDIDPLGCAGEASVEDVHKDTFTFKAPRHRGRGTLTFRIDGFVADWDLYVFKGTTVLGSSTTDNLSQDYEALTVSGIRGGTKLDIVACNWSSPTPQANGTGTYKFRR